MNQVSCKRGLPRPKTAGRQHRGAAGVLRVAHRLVADHFDRRRAGHARERLRV